jgi:hypothetical protein
MSEPRERNAERPVVLLTRLCVGQRATVLQLPPAVRPETREKEATPELRELSPFS